MILTLHWKPWLALVVRCAIWVLLLCSTAAGAEDRVHRFIQYTVEDQDGNFFPIGEVEFCTPEGQCLYADIEDDFPGHFVMLSENLEPGTAYSVRIYDSRVAVHYEMHNWVYSPRDYDPSFDRIIEVDKFLVYPRFHGTADGGLVFHLDTTLNPEWAKRKNISQFTGPDSLPDFPKLIAGFNVPVMLGGKFRTDPGALGGVTHVRPGLGVSGSIRFGYPRHLPARDHWVFFHELTVAYQQNRYETREIMTPGRLSDVTFHRLKLSYSMGQMSQSYGSHWSVGVSAAFGGVYDGSQVLRYLGRDYKRSGFGCRATWLQKTFTAGRIDVGVSLQLELMYYFADTIADDYWHGVAPSASFGLVVF